MATKPAKSKAKSNRGGARAGAGRKPKAVTEIRAALIAPMMPADGPAPSDSKTAAEYALALFERHMRDEAQAIDTRLDCAREVLNRTIGKPRIAEPARPESDDGDQVHIYIPDNGRQAAV